MSDDPVNHPRHYNSHKSGIEVIQITEHMNFCRGNAIKYIMRAGLKGDEVEDLKKALWYINREIARCEVGTVSDEEKAALDRAAAWAEEIHVGDTVECIKSSAPKLIGKRVIVSSIDRVNDRIWARCPGDPDESWLPRNCFKKVST